MYTYLGVDSDDFIALLTAVGEDRLVACNAVGMFVTKYVTLSCQTLIALPATEMLTVPILVHGLCVFATENKL